MKKTVLLAVLLGYLVAPLCAYTPITDNGIIDHGFDMIRWRTLWPRFELRIKQMPDDWSTVQDRETKAFFNYVRMLHQSAVDTVHIG